jgi:hypothetical protein
MKIALPFAFLLSQLIAPIGIAAEPSSPIAGTVAVKALACRDWNFVTRLYDYLDKTDKREFLIEAQKAVLSGSCSLFEPGEAVYLSDVGVSFVKLRRKNDSDEYWARRQAIEPARS